MSQVEGRPVDYYKNEYEKMTNRIIGKTLVGSGHIHEFLTEGDMHELCASAIIETADGFIVCWPAELVKFTDVGGDNGD